MVPLPENIRIFPLSEVVLFPDTLLPLHIFEPRYRAMLSDALATDGIIGMTLIKDAQAPEPAAVYATGCAGRVVEHEEFDDGRSMIVLRGTAKFRILEELDTDEPYRVVRAQALYEGPPAMEDVRGWRDELRRCVEKLAHATNGEDGAVSRVFDRLELMSIVNYLSAAMPLSVAEKQSLLECPTVERRFMQLRELIQFKAAEARLGLDSGRAADS